MVVGPGPTDELSLATCARKTYDTPNDNKEMPGEFDVESNSLSGILERMPSSRWEFEPVGECWGKSSLQSADDSARAAGEVFVDIVFYHVSDVRHLNTYHHDVLPFVRSYRTAQLT